MKTDIPIPGNRGNLLFTYLDPTRHGLVAVTDSGYRLIQKVGESKWTDLTKIKPEVNIDDWVTLKKSWMTKLLESRSSFWRVNVTALPSIETLNHWAYDGVCETLTGDTIEPDGTGIDQSPSWLLALGLV
jgi:hypothetical protein